MNESIVPDGKLQTIIAKLTLNSHVGGLVLSILLDGPLSREEIKVQTLKKYNAGTEAEEYGIIIKPKKELAGTYVDNLLDEMISEGILSVYRSEGQPYVKLSDEAIEDFLKVGGTD